MQYFIILIAIIAFGIKQIKKSGSQSGSQQGGSGQAQQGYRYTPSSAQRTAATARSAAASSTGRYSTSSNAGGFGRANYRSVGSANITRDGRVYASIDFDNTHYHAEGFDFDCCISFKGLPPGTDELAVLIASNNRHERELAKLLQERQN